MPWRSTSCSRGGTSSWLLPKWNALHHHARRVPPACTAMLRCTSALATMVVALQSASNCLCGVGAVANVLLRGTANLLKVAPFLTTSHQVLLGGGISGNPVIHQHDLHVCGVYMFVVHDDLRHVLHAPIVSTSHDDSCFGVAAGKGTPSRRTADSTCSGSTSQELGQLHGRMQAAGKGMELRYRCTCSI
jgi:hypothetical protein